MASKPETAMAWTIQNQVSWRRVASPALAEKWVTLLAIEGAGAASALVVTGGALPVVNIGVPDTVTGFGSTLSVTYFSLAGSKYEKVALGVRFTGACGIRT